MWENKLRRIERNEYSAATFIDELKQMIASIVNSVLSDNTRHNIAIEVPEKDAPKKETKPRAPRKPRVIDSLDKIKCPICKKGHLLKGKTAYGCSEYCNGCTFVLPFSQYPDTLTPDELSKMIKKK